VLDAWVTVQGSVVYCQCTGIYGRQSMFGLSMYVLSLCNMQGQLRRRLDEAAHAQPL